MCDSEPKYHRLLNEERRSRDSGETDLAEHWIRSRAKLTRAAWTIHLTFLLLHMCLALVSVLLFLAWRRPCAGPDEWKIYSPATAAVDWETVYFDSEPVPKSLLVQDPSPAVDKAWDDVLKYSNIRLSPTEMAAMNKLNDPNNVVLPDTGEYVGQLYVYHQLHCLKRLYQYSWPEYYFPNYTEEDFSINRFHNMHCIDQLRQGVLCNGDTQVTTFKWLEWTNFPSVNDTAPHQCVNFAKIDRWSKERSVDNIYDPGYLMHPTLGPAYPEGKGHKLGVLRKPDQA